MDKNLRLEAINGDVLEVLKNIPDKSINLIVTDPPYNLSKDYGTTKDNMETEEYIEWSKKWLLECSRVLKDDGTIYVFMGVRFISYIYTILEKDLGFEFNSWITWYYTQGIGKKKGFSPRHDDILMFTKTSKFKFNLDNIRVPQKYYRSINNMRGANPGNVWEFSHVHYCQKSRKPHPTQKPEGIYERIILASSEPGDTVLDPFLGSGTALRVCQHTGRNCIGIDINSNYINDSLLRIEETFNGFDSIDKRFERVPNDLNDPKIRIEYIENHINWFLKNHEGSIEIFIKEVLKKYLNKLTEYEIERLKEITNLNIDKYIKQITKSIEKEIDQKIIKKNVAYEQMELL